ncbi:hypothetical protein MMC24_000813 [Lignoscripta atroalba]|nr:hypothetical protein [Lignoscripta atroalba]
MAETNNDISSLKTPEKCVADFCLIPIGTPTASVSQQIADVQRLMQKSGLTYSMHSAGTTVAYRERKANGSCEEGSWDAVMKLIGQAHTVLHEKGILRIQTDIRVGSRIDKKQSFSDKVKAVNDLLAADKQE